MSFILENPVLAFLVLSVFGFVIFMITKMFDEVKLNKALNMKQRSMRIKSFGTGLKARMSLMASATLAPVAVVAMMFAFGGETPTGPINIQEQPVFGAFSEAGDVISLFQEFSQKKSHSENWFWQRNGWFLMEDAEMAVDDLTSSPEPQAPQDKSGGEGSDDFSETNNQVVGVDEMDNVLTDGKYMYVVNWDKVQIALAYTSEYKSDALDLHYELDFSEFENEGEHFGAIGMYVDNDYLIVIGNVYKTVCHTYKYYDDAEEPVSDDVPEGGYTEEYCYDYWQDNNTKVFVFDKTDFYNARPEEGSLQPVNEYSFSGWFVGTRKIGSSLYFVTNEYIPFYLAENEQVEFNLDEYLPRFAVDGQVETVAYDEIVYIDGTEPANFTTFYGINLDTTETTMEVVLGEGGYNLYVSTENIYLAGTKYIFNETLFVEGDAVTDNVDVEEDVVNPYEYSTSILRIGIEDGVVDYTGTAEVDGIGLDQFSMDEKDGYLRVVTTTQSWWWWGNAPQINNRLFILDENLEEVSRIENIGEEGESVQATRFVGDYAYIVTFLRTDPFYMIDLSDPLNPEIIGELKIPGFSDYLQPIGTDYMLGIGYGDHDGGTQGLKISLYDVSNKTPDENGEVVIPEPVDVIYDYADGNYIWTSTMYNHKDLLVSLEKGIIALPYTKNGYRDNYWSYSSGVLVLNLDVENGQISERGFVEHSEGTRYDTYVYKSKFIGDSETDTTFFYTVSNKFIKVSDLNDLFDQDGNAKFLNELQIGETWEDLEVPSEIPVEVDPVDPVGTIMDEIEHLLNWEELPVGDAVDFIVYTYSDDCAQCSDIEELIFEFYVDGPDTPKLFVVNIDAVDGEAPSEYVLDFNPSIMIYESGVFQDTIAEIDPIISYLDSLR